MTVYNNPDLYQDCHDPKQQPVPNRTGAVGTSIPQCNKKYRIYLACIIFALPTIAAEELQHIDTVMVLPLLTENPTSYTALRRYQVVIRHVLVQPVKNEDHRKEHQGHQEEVGCYNNQQLPRLQSPQSESTADPYYPAP